MIQIFKVFEKDFGGAYSISMNGEIFSHKRNIYLKPFPDYKRGYFKIKLYDINGIAHTMSIHKLVAIYYVDGYFKDAEVNHEDGYVTNNYYTNLSWVTPLQNVRHSIDFCNSEFRGNQLQETDVHKICELLFKENKGPTEVSKILNIPKTTIDKISQRKNYIRISELYI